MDTVGALRKFKETIKDRVNKKTGWGKNELSSEIDRAYQEVLETLINPQRPPIDGPKSSGTNTGLPNEPGS